MGRSPPPTMKQRRKQRTRKPTATAARPANDKSTSIAKFKRYGENSISTDCKKQRNLPIWSTPVPQIRRVLALDGANLAVRVPVPRSIYPRTGHFAPKGPSNPAVSVKCHNLTPNSSSSRKSEQNGVFKMQKNLHMTCLWPPPTTSYYRFSPGRKRIWSTGRLQNGPHRRRSQPVQNHQHPSKTHT